MLVKQIAEIVTENMSFEKSDEFKFNLHQIPDWIPAI